MLTMSKSLEQTTRDTLNLLEKMAADANLKDEITLQATIEQTEIIQQCKTLIMAKNSQELAETLQLDKLITSVNISTPFEEELQEDSSVEECA